MQPLLQEIERKFPKRVFVKFDAFQFLSTMLLEDSLFDQSDRNEIERKKHSRIKK